MWQNITSGTGLVIFSSSALPAVSSINRYAAWSLRDVRRRGRRSHRIIADSFQVAEALKEIAERDPGFYPRERGAKAEVDTVAEGGVRIGVASDVEFFRPRTVHKIDLVEIA